MIKAAIDKIIDLSGIHQITIHGDEYVKEDVSRIIKSEDYAPKPIKVSSLLGLVDYTRTMFQEDFHGGGPPAFVIYNHASVGLVGPIQKKNLNNRFIYATADLVADDFKFGTWHSQEAMIINLLTKFVPDEDTKNLISRIASIEHVSSHLSEDDGQSQVVEIKQGLRLKGQEKMVNPVTLRPWRTFRDINQPASEFVVRLDSKRGRDGDTQVALFEADGAQWKYQAMAYIDEYLTLQMEGSFIKIKPLVYG